MRLTILLHWIHGFPNPPLLVSPKSLCSLLLFIIKLFLSSGNEVWVGPRNTGCPSVRPTYKRNIFTTVSTTTSNLKYDFTPSTL